MGMEGESYKVGGSEGQGIVIAPGVDLSVFGVSDLPVLEAWLAQNRPAAGQHDFASLEHNLWQTVNGVVMGLSLQRDLQNRG